MAHFCTDCEKLLVLKTVGKKIVNFCTDCKKHYEIKSNILRENKTGTLTNKMLKTAIYDDVMPRVKKKCPCGHDIMVYFTDEETYRNTYVCRACRSSFQLK